MQNQNYDSIKIDQNKFDAKYREKIYHPKIIRKNLIHFYTKYQNEQKFDTKKCKSECHLNQCIDY